MATNLQSVGRIEKRNRPPVSCEPCRSRKLKCNRDLPCDTCVRRNKSSLCHYAVNASRNKPSSSVPRDLKDRLKTLENLVSSVLSGESGVQHQTHLTTWDDETVADTGSLAASSEQRDGPPQTTSTPGSVSRGESVLTPETLYLQETEAGQVNYVDPSHWRAVLEDIKEVRDHLSALNHTISQDEPILELYFATSDPSLIFGSNSSANLAEILSSLPPQPSCDMLLSSYFNSRFMILGIVHPTKFQKEYEAFHDSPSTASVLWISLLFSILSIATSLRRISNPFDLDGSLPSPGILQQRAVQCLILGKYTTANTHALEALMLHLQSCFLSHDHDAFNMWFEMGTIIRLAFRMAYHRDPSNLASISPFDGEMRRRLWLNIVQIDALMSYQLGFPSSIPSEYCDTKTPRNLEHTDLDVSMTILPPARPLSEMTSVRYTIVKNGVMRVFKKIVAHTQTLPSPAYERAITLDLEMKQAYIDIPDVMKRRDVNRSFMDPSVLIWERCTIELLYLKGLIVLHRRYISYEPQTSLSEPSRRTCVDAALDILTRLEDVHTACEPSGRLHEERWMFLLLPVHDFLLAAMVVCLDLSVRMRSGAIDLLGGQSHQDLTAKEYHALQSSLKIWTSNGAIFPEAHVAALAIDLMIKRVTDNNTGPLLTDIALPADMNMDFDSELPYASSMAQMIDGSESIDWGLLDQYFQNLDGEPNSST